MGIVGIIQNNTSMEKTIAFSKYLFLKEKIFVVDNTSINDKRTINTILKNINTSLSKKKYEELLLMINIKEDILKKKANELSSTEISKVKLAIGILNKSEIIIMNEIDKYLIDKDLKKTISIINLINKKSKIKLLVLSKNILFLKNICDFYYYIDRDFIHGTNNFKEMFFDENIKPELYSFLEISKTYGHDLDKYDDVKEIIKAIYRGE